MGPRTRTYLLVALAAAGAAGLVVATVAFTRTSTGGRVAASTQTTASARGRAPALVLDLGVRTDPEAAALRRANRLYAAGKRAAAGRIFARYSSVQAQVGAAVAAWPSGADVWLRAAAARAALLGRARVRGGRESGSGRRRGTDRCGSRPLLEGQTGRCFLAARPLGTALSAFSDRPVPSGRAPGLDRRARQGSPGVSARPCGGPAHAAGQDRERVPRATKSQVTAAQGPGAQGPGAQGPFPFSQSQKAFACDADQKAAAA